MIRKSRRFPHSGAGWDDPRGVEESHLSKDGIRIRVEEGGAGEEGNYPWNEERCIEKDGSSVRRSGVVRRGE